MMKALRIYTKKGVSLNVLQTERVSEIDLFLYFLRQKRIKMNIPAY